MNRTLSRRAARTQLIRIADGRPIALAWYTREAWHQLAVVADDPDALNSTYEDWEAGALALLRKLRSAGQRVHKVLIDIDALVAWCDEEGCKVDSSARARFASLHAMGAPPPAATKR